MFKLLSFTEIAGIIRPCLKVVRDLLQINLIKKKTVSPAFTLAETLIVMGIIGVIATLTIPNLTQSTNDKEKIAKLQKVYSSLSDAFGRTTAVYGPVTEWSGGNANISVRFSDRMLDFLKVTKNCGVAANSGCFTSGSDVNLDNTGDMNYSNAAYPKLILADGSSVLFQLSSQDCSENLGTTTDSPLTRICGYIVVDVDGPNKGAFVSGKDIFHFYITLSGIYPSGTQTDVDAETDAGLTSNCFTSGIVCAGWVIQNNSMEYLKTTNGTCSNGTTLSWTVTKCN